VAAGDRPAVSVWSSKTVPRAWPFTSTGPMMMMLMMLLLLLLIMIMMMMWNY
jgi:hypothetical protein